MLEEKIAQRLAFAGGVLIERSPIGIAWRLTRRSRSSVRGSRRLSGVAAGRSRLWGLIEPAGNGPHEGLTLSGEPRTLRALEQTAEALRGSPAPDAGRHDEAGQASDDGHQEQPTHKSKHP